MKTILTLSAFLMFSAAPVLAQTDAARTAEPIQQNEPESGHHNYGWMGLLGLAGLVGLRRQKSEDVRRLEATGINVETVKTA